MGWVAGPELVAATGNAGGFGFLAGATIPAEQVEADIKRVGQLSPAPFGVNFHMYQPNASEIVDCVIKHQVRAVSYSRSPDKDTIAKLKDHKVICMPTVGLPKHALAAIELGADAIVVQGSEGGGHTGPVPTSLLILKVVDVIAGRVPLAAAGGFWDGRSLIAALAWGADGIAMGTRFLMSKESSPPLVTKNRYVECVNPDEIRVSRAVDGLPHRMINNEVLFNLNRAGRIKSLLMALRSGLKYQRFTGTSFFKLLQSALAMTRTGSMTMAQALMSANAPMMIQKAMVDGQPEKGILPSGQVASMITELQSCEEIINAIMSEANACLKALARPAGAEIP